MYTLVTWLCRAAVGIGNRIWGNETVMTFLKTGVYKYWVPLGGVIHYEVPPQLSIHPIQLPPSCVVCLQSKTEGTTTSFRIVFSENVTFVAPKDVRSWLVFVSVGSGWQAWL